MFFSTMYKKATKRDIMYDKIVAFMDINILMSNIRKNTQSGAYPTIKYRDYRLKGN